MICSPPTLWKEVPGKKVLFPEEVMMVLGTGGSSAIARSGLFKVKANTPHLTASSPHVIQVGEREAQGGAHLAPSPGDGEAQLCGCREPQAIILSAAQWDSPDPRLLPGRCKSQVTSEEHWQLGSGRIPASGGQNARPRSGQQARVQPAENTSVSRQGLSEPEVGLQRQAAGRAGQGTLPPACSDVKWLYLAREASWGWAVSDKPTFVLAFGEFAGSDRWLKGMARPSRP